MLLSCLSYVRCPFVLLYCVLSLVFLATMAIVGTFFIKTKSFGTLMQKMWCQGILWSAGLRVKVEGEENLPERNAAFLFNHASLLDIPVIAASLPVDLRFAAKKELFKIPIFGQGIKSVGTLPIDRSNRQKTIGVYKEATERVQSDGLSIALAPEGTRQREEALGPFKSGPFIFAIQAQLPIVPVVIKGVREALPKKSLMINCGCWQREITLKILPAIDTRDYPLESRKDLKDKVRHKMVQAFEQLSGRP